jgi:transposase
VAEGRSVETVETLAGALKGRGCAPEQVSSVSIDMSPAFIKGCTAQFPNARIAFDKFHVVWHASFAVDKMRRLEQRTDHSRACVGRCSKTALAWHPRLRPTSTL